jgi:hypothetical protein
MRPPYCDPLFEANIILAILETLLVIAVFVVEVG